MDSVEYEGFRFQVFQDVYRPAEDTFLIIENLDLEKEEKVLEIGTGCGIISILAAEEGANVVATDISSEALKCSKENARIHGVEDKIDFREGNLFEPILSEEFFDLIIFNPPYLPVKDEKKLETKLSQAWDGGPEGRKYIDEFLEKFEKYLRDDGRVLLVQSSLSGKDETLKEFERKGFKVKISEEKFFFENICLFEARSKA